jgi:hypothetical protein
MAFAALRITAAPFARRCFHSSILAVMIAALAPPVSSFAQPAPAFTPRDESPEEFPPGAGRDDTFYACTACHGFKLVAQQGMNRRQWDDTLDVMTKVHGMPALEGGDRKVVLDYLEAAFPPAAPARGRGSPNPFLNR